MTGLDWVREPGLVEAMKNLIDPRSPPDLRRWTLKSDGEVVADGLTLLEVLELAEKLVAAGKFRCTVRATTKTGERRDA